MADALA